MQMSSPAIRRERAVYSRVLENTALVNVIGPLYLHLFERHANNGGAD